MNVRTTFPNEPERLIDSALELEMAAGNVRQAHIDLLLKLGVPASVIASGVDHAPFGVVHAEAIGGAYWQPAPHGQAHVIQPVIADGQIIDLIAWRTAEPKRWQFRTGFAWCLGEDNFTRRAWDAGEPLQVHATPLEFLKSAGTGLVVLDWDAAELRDLITVEVIACDPSITRLLIERLSRPIRMPRFIPLSMGGVNANPSR